ncbi:MAG: PilZ domain-containing protein [Planctomycetes bacterium]|nr:PilZ domain-containing protein [Planctomycetota bacterium]
MRVKAEFAVRYKFLSKTRTDRELEAVYEGKSANIGGGGLLLQCQVPKLEWIPDLLLQRMAVGCNLLLPTADLPIKVLTRVAWIEALDEETRSFAVGLKFREITSQDQDAVFRFIIRAQMPS